MRIEETIKGPENMNISNKNPFPCTVVPFLCLFNWLRRYKRKVGNRMCNMRIIITLFPLFAKCRIKSFREYVWIWVFCVCDFPYKRGQKASKCDRGAKRFPFLSLRMCHKVSHFTQNINSQFSGVCLRTLVLLPSNLTFR